METKPHAVHLCHIMCYTHNLIKFSQPNCYGVINSISLEGRLTEVKNSLASTNTQYLSRQARGKNILIILNQ
jgi:hypothetical protein